MESTELLRDSAPVRRTPILIGYVAAIGFAAVAVTGASAADLPAAVRAGTAGFWVIAALAVLVDARPFTAPGMRHQSGVFPSICFTFALLLGWGLGAAVIVQSVAVLVSSVRLRHPPWRAAFNAAQYVLALAAAWLVLQLAQLPPLRPGVRLTPAQLVMIIAAVGVWFAVNDWLLTTANWLRLGECWWGVLVRAVRQEALAALSLLVLGPVVVAAANVSAAMVPLMLVPLYAVNQLARLSAEEQRKSLRDTLTGLPNRKALFAEMTTLGERRPGRGLEPPRMALLLLDIDLFKQVNAALGHGVGDRLLAEVAVRLQGCVRGEAMVARLGGDEFAILAPRLRGEASARLLAERVAASLAEPVILGGLPLDVNAAIGIAISPDHGADHLTLLRHADVAMYDAKNRGATFAHYAPESDHNSIERLELLADLRRALELPRTNEIALYYQPQVEIRTGEVVGLEALLRWHHPRRGLINPEELIKVAEQTAVMRLLTRRVVDDVVAQLAVWRGQGLEPRTAINVSVRDLHRPDLADQLTALLRESGVQPNQVQLEITEGALMADPRRVLVTLHRLDRLGVALSLDDFGTGYSSLQHLRRLPLAEVKIDRSFVLGMATDPDDAAVVRSIIELSGALGLRVVAEGVEDDRTRRMLSDIGCEVAQGWFYARPMPAEELVSWLSRYRPVPATPLPFSR